MRRNKALALIFALLVAAPAVAQPVLPTNVDKDRLGAEAAWRSVREMKPGQRPRVVLVLGGGGARGLAHIGVLRVLEEEGIPIDEIVGVSVGAMVGALYSSGLSVDKIELLTHDIGWQSLTDFSHSAMLKLVISDELLSSKRMEDYLAQQIGRKHFSDLNIPFSCVATDIRTGERVVFKEGPVAVATRASATIPAIFKPVEYRQRLLVDGGLVDNLPTDVPNRPGEWDIIIGVLPIGEYTLGDTTNVFRSLVRAIDIQKDIIIEEKKKGADFMIEPDVGDVSPVDLGRGAECIEAGTVAARKSALNLKALILSRIQEHRKQAAAR
ncbi:MAG: patatin-like phospholipase family protein [Elusimicrobia bacterium]|nr:patatin-like phospholipase family protein [Elusimicrobiota bacterium]